MFQFGTMCKREYGDQKKAVDRIQVVLAIGNSLKSSVPSTGQDTFAPRKHGHHHCF